MKKLLTAMLTGVLMFLGTGAFAQYSAGGGFSNITLSGADAKNWDFSLPGFYAGINYDIAFSNLEGLTFEPGVYFAHYGKTFGNKTFPEQSYHANYLIVPMNIKYGFEASPDFKIAGYTGPRFNLGFAGNAFNKKLLAFKNLDAQWGFGAVLTFADAVQLRAGYDFGLTKAIKNGVSGTNLKVRRNDFHIGVGFIF